MGKKKSSTGAWSTDPAEALMAGADFDLDQMDRGATPGWDDDKRPPRSSAASAATCSASCRSGSSPRAEPDGGRALLVIVQGLDTAGKGGVARHVMSKVDPQGVALRSFGPPTDEEQKHHFLWRIRKELPDARPHRRLRPVALRGRAGRPGRRAGPTRDLGGALRRDQPVRERPRRGGHDVLKFAMMVSHDEQGMRLMKRLDRPDKHWKYSANDLPTRRQWDDYQEAYADVFRAPPPTPRRGTSSRPTTSGTPVWPSPRS